MTKAALKIIQKSKAMEKKPMSVLALKDRILDMVSKIEDEETIRHLYEVITQIIAESKAYNVELTPEQQATLDLAIEETFDPENLIDHEQVMELMKRFRQK